MGNNNADLGDGHDTLNINRCAKLHNGGDKFICPGFTLLNRDSWSGRHPDEIPISNPVSEAIRCAQEIRTFAGPWGHCRCWLKFKQEADRARAEKKLWTGSMRRGLYERAERDC